MALRVLLTNNTLALRAGSELYLRDVALALLARGHTPIAYSPTLGEMADDLRRATIPVIDDLRHLGEPPDVIHGQHVLTIPAAVHAAHRTRRPVVATIRDYWPVCYWGTLIYDDEAADLCPACTVSGMGRCLRPRTGAAWPLALGAIPYMRRNLRIKRSTLGDADAIIAVSRQIASDLRARAPELRNVPIDQIPNPFDIAALRAELKDDITGVKGEVAALKAEIFRFLYLQAVGIIGITVALIKLLP